MPLAGVRIFCFEGFTLDLRRGCLRGAHGEINLRPKSFAVLCYLVENAGRLVAKDELIMAVWPSVVVTDESLARCISDVRLALRDANQRIIRTMPRRGYLFAAAVTASTPPSPYSPVTYTHASPLLPLPEKPSLAVLPFDNFGDDPAQGYFADGMVEEITTALSRIKWLFVISRNSSFAYKGRAADVRQIGRELGVRYILEGSVRKAGNRVRIAVQLIDAVSGGHVWANRYDADLGNLLELQDRIAGSVAGQVEPRLRDVEIGHANRKAPQTLDVYDLYLRALGEFHNHTEVATHAAISLLRQALASDPAYVSAAALVCECRLTLRLHAWAALTKAEVRETIDLATYSIRKGKDDPDALWMAAISLANFAQGHDEAARALDRAVSLNPNSAPAWNAKGWVTLYRDAPGTPIDAFRQALRLSPLDPMRGYFTCGLALANLLEGDYEEALAWATQSVDEMPRYTSAIRVLAAAYAQLNRLDEARIWLQRLLQLHPGLTVGTLRSSVATYSQKLGRLLEQSLCKAGLSPD